MKRSAGDGLDWGRHHDSATKRLSGRAEAKAEDETKEGRQKGRRVTRSCSARASKARWKLIRLLEGYDLHGRRLFASMARPKRLTKNQPGKLGNPGESAH